MEYGGRFLGCRELPHWAAGGTAGKHTQVSLQPSPTPPVVHLLVGSIPIALLLAWAALLHGSLVQNSPTQSRLTGTAMEKPRWGKHVAGHALPPALGLAMPKDGVRYAQTPQGPGKSQLLGG